MADANAHEAFGSSSRCTYQVFLSFRGEDTRKNFTDHLYRALLQQGIRTFRDSDTIKKGENIDMELLKAIRWSKISIVVFSKDYASSRWCLDELVKIMDCKKNFGCFVLPVFYNVDPTHVRRQTGSFAEAFRRHEERFRNEMEKVERWRAALREVADLAGMALHDRHEAQFVQEIVKEVDSKLRRKALHVSAVLVGIDKHVEEINLWLREESNDVSIAAISGIGGIGKTTIAKVVFNLNLDKFEGRSFLANIRETSEQNNGLIRLQKQLLSDLLGGEKHKIYNVDEGLIKIKDALCCRRILLVLDDMDDADQFNAVIGMCKWISRGSKVIITTRNEHLLRMNNVQKAFKIKELGYEDSLRLLSWYAFGEYHPVESFKGHCRRIVQHCRGLPLALQTLGSSLSGKSIKVWESALAKLETIPNSKVLKILKISYDSLQDDHDKNLFLDIACFFNGMDKDYSGKILDGCGFHTTDGVQNLIDRCLLTIDENNKLRMHALLRDMGREIIRQESPEDPGRRSRLWRYEDAFDVLIENMGTKKVKGLSLDLLKLMEEKHPGNSGNVPFLNDIRGETRAKALKFSFSALNDMELEAKSFAKMCKLKLLQLDHVKLKGNYDCFPKGLVWLRWRGFPLSSIPIEWCMSKLVALDMCYSRLKHLWKGTKFLPSLRVLDLSHSHALVKTPEFSGLPTLEILRLKDCTGLVELDESIADLERLAFLTLEGCINLVRLPRKIVNLRSLEELILSGCKRLEALPKDLRELKSLTHLHLEGIAMNRLRLATASIEKLDILAAESLDLTPLSQRRSLSSITSPLAFLPSSLVKLNVADCCISDNAFVSDLSSLFSLTHLDLSGNPISTLPESISSLTSLMVLKLDRCKKLRSLPMLPITLLELSMSYCSSLERLVNIPNFKYSIFNFIGCDKLFKVPGMSKLRPTTDFHVEAESPLRLLHTESARKTEVNFRNVIKDTKVENVPLQELWRCGLISTFLPGNKVSSGFSHQDGQPVIAFDLPLGRPKIFGLNLRGLTPVRDLFDIPAGTITISNETKAVQWVYRIDSREMHRGVVDTITLSHTDFWDLFEGGDHVKVFLDMSCNFELKRCGIFLICEPDNVDMTANKNPSWYLTSDVYKDWRVPDGYDLSDYKTDHLWLMRAEEVPQDFRPAAISGIKLLSNSSGG